MFTGIIEEIGTVLSITKKVNGAFLKISAQIVLEGTKLGDSISINGVCQTVVALYGDSFCVDVSDETLRVTTFNELKIGEYVNLERALLPTSRLGGHIVSGHVEGGGKLVEINKFSSFYELSFEIPQTLTRYVINKGSITINGISLTVANIDGCVVRVAIIPHTFNNTNLKFLNKNDNVNIETDIIAKYIENFVNPSSKKVSNINLTFLAENGFI